MTNIVMFSSGIGSWAAAKRLSEQHPNAPLTLLFADTNVEDADNYRFLNDSASALIGQELAQMHIESVTEQYNINGPIVTFTGDSGSSLVWITNGNRTIWDIFREEQFLGNTRLDPCSKYLKRRPMRRWLRANCNPDVDVVVMGFGWEEKHRLEKATLYWLPWKVSAPMTEEPFMTKDQVLGWARSIGLEPPRLYNIAGGKLPHANCGGLCVKAGQVQFALAHKELPELFAEWEREEQGIRDLLGDVAILRDRRKSATDPRKTRPLPLSDFRKRLEAVDSKVDNSDVGSCACMEPSDD